MKRSFRVIIEKHADGYVAYPIGMKTLSSGRGTHMKTPLRM